MAATSASTRPSPEPPIGGVFACYNRGKKTFHGQDRYFQVLHTHAKRAGIGMYVFAPEDVYWEKNQVKGFTYHQKKKRWIRGTFPLPDVVYNRIQTRALERRTDIRETLKRFEQTKHIPLFNRRFLDKSTVHQSL